MYELEKTDEKERIEYEIGREVRLIGEHLEKLDHAINSLRKRCADIIEEYPTEKLDSKLSEGCGTVLGDKLKNFNGSLESCINNLNNLKENIRL
jgi:hypothetical protein